MILTIGKDRVSLSVVNLVRHDGKAQFQARGTARREPNVNEAEDTNKNKMNKASRPKVVAGMPAYNEAKYIGSLVLEARKYVDEVIVIDDGSTDQTAEIAELAGATVVRHTGNKGYGSAIQSILFQAKQRDANILVIFDADAQHSPQEIPVLVKAVSEGSDVVIGSRELRRNVIAPYRRLGQGILSRLTYIASRRKLSDTESGFRAYSRKAIYTLKLKEKGMAASSEIVSEAVAKGLKLAEVPVSVSYTKDGSTLNPVKHGFGVLNRIMVMISERRPLLFFGLVGGILLVLGLVAGAEVVLGLYFRPGGLKTGTALVSVLLVTTGLLTLFTGVILDVLVKRINDKL